MHQINQLNLLRNNSETVTKEQKQLKRSMIKKYPKIYIDIYIYIYIYIYPEERQKIIDNLRLI